jgi:hypothetical protein
VTPFVQKDFSVTLEGFVAILAEGKLTLAELNVPGIFRRPEKTASEKA